MNVDYKNIEIDTYREIIENMNTMNKNRITWLSDSINNVSSIEVKMDEIKDKLSPIIPSETLDLIYEYFSLKKEKELEESVIKNLEAELQNICNVAVN